MLIEHNTKPIQGCILPVNADTGEQFPNCCEIHQRMVLELSEWFEKFPNCCKHHSELAANGIISKEQYTGIVEKIIIQFWYTQDCITRKIENEDWFDEITEYIEYTIDSFGFSEIGAGDYRHYLKKWLQNRLNDNLEKIKLQRIIDFTENYGKVNDSNADLHLLYSTYQKWLKLFPFEISLFADLKPRFESLFEMTEGGLLAIHPQLLLSGHIKKNRYSNIVKVEIHTESSFVEALQKLTKYLLSSLNIAELRKQGVINDLTATQLEFCEATLKTKTERITKDYTKGELEYLNTLEEWLGVHKEYFNEIKTLLEISPIQPKNIKEAKLNINQIALKHFYEGLSITRENGNQIAKQYGHNSGEKLFQRFTYFSSSANRRGRPTPDTRKKLENKIKLFESVIDLLPNDKRRIANDELLILISMQETDY